MAIGEHKIDQLGTTDLHNCVCGMHQMLAFIAMNVTWLWLSEQYWQCSKQFIMYSAVHKSYKWHKWLLLYWLMATNTLVGNLITCCSHSCFVYLIFFVTKHIIGVAIAILGPYIHWKLHWIIQTDQKPPTHVSWGHHKLLLSKPSPCAGVCRLVAAEVAVSRRRTWSTPSLHSLATPPPAQPVYEVSVGVGPSYNVS